MRDRFEPARHVLGRLVMCAIGMAIATPTLAEAPSERVREFAFEYTTRVGPIEAGAGPVHVFVPLARASEQQTVVSEDIRASIPGRVEVEERYGNRFWHGAVAESDGRAIEVAVTTHVTRKFAPRGATSSEPKPVREDLEKFLRANERVVVGDALLEPILTEVRGLAASDEPAAVARAAYDWVVDNVEYKKTGNGWGNGDTHWACTERYGNCTDFHALFTSLARTQGIPARFEIGFPVAEDRSEGEIGGYHCWVEFYLPETGWFPIDASEAFKHPEKREFFYGSHAMDRIHFTTGRDLRLGTDHADRPLNYFIYPYVEVAGKRFEGEIDRAFSFREAPTRVGAR